MSYQAEKASLTEEGHVQLSSSLNGTSESLAATEKAIKVVNDRFINTMVKRQILEDSTDLNTITDTGFYTGGATAINKPTQITYGTFFTLEVIKDGEVLQRFISKLTTQGNAIFQRIKIGDTWTPWKQIIMSDLIMRGSGSPEGVISADIGTVFLRTDGSTSTTLYIKTNGTGNTGWTAK